MSLDPIPLILSHSQIPVSWDLSIAQERGGEGFGDFFLLAFGIVLFFKLLLIYIIISTDRRKG
ncbi:MAG: hypothetical protein ACLFS6_09880 [Methanomassiliicoccales archaeon]